MWAPCDGSLVHSLHKFEAHVVSPLADFAVDSVSSCKVTSHMFFWVLRGASSPAGEQRSLDTPVLHGISFLFLPKVRDPV